MAHQHEECCYEKIPFTCCLAYKGLSNNGVGVGRGTVLQEMRPGAGFKTGYFVDKTLGGLPTGERLKS